MIDFRKERHPNARDGKKETGIAGRNEIYQEKGGGGGINVVKERKGECHMGNPSSSKKLILR